MSHVRVMFVGNAASNLPEDRVVNVFHFDCTGTYAEAAPQALAAVQDFYVTSRATNSVGGYLSPWIQRAAQLQAYDMDIPKGTRVPTILPITLGGPFGDGIPEEVACCITLHGYVPPALSRRRAGRIFIGPLSSNALQSGSTTAPSRPSSLFIADLVLASIALRDNGPNQIVWSIRSITPAENYVHIQGGFVDNAFDTQRRRGPKPTVKTPWVGTSIDPGVL